MISTPEKSAFVMSVLEHINNAQYRARFDDITLSNFVRVSECYNGTGHIERIGKGKIPRRTLEGQHGGRRLVERSRNRWEDMVQRYATNLLRVRNWREMARNRGG